MLLAINIGNADISVGLFELSSVKLCSKFKLSSDPARTVDEYYAIINSIFRENQVDSSKISGAVISSVVPQMTETIRECAEKFTVDVPLVVGPGVKTGFSIKIDNPSELGGDIVANAAAVVNMQRTENKKTTAIIADVGTVTTVSAIKNGEYLGCAISPGIKMSLDALHGSTAQLPNVAYSNPDSAIGKNSKESVLSGVIIGNATMLDGFVFKFARDMRCRSDDIALYITGDYAKYLLPHCRCEFSYVEDLTLLGLYNIYINSQK